MSFELSLKCDHDEDEVNKVDEDKEVRVGIKDWLVNFPYCYKKIINFGILEILYVKLLNCFDIAFGDVIF